MRRTPTRDPLLAIAAVLTAVGVASVGLGSYVASLTAGAPTDPPRPSVPRATLQPTPSGTTPPTAVVTVPPALDATGGTDVTASLQAIIDQAPDGAVIRFPARARYQVAGPLTIEGRTGLTIDGGGATLVQLELGDDPGRGIWRIRESRGTRLHDFRLEGANPDPGVFVQGFEWQHSVAVEGSVGTVLERLDMDRPMGDCVYIAHGATDWSSRVSVIDSVCRGAARQGVAVVGGRDILVTGSTFGTIGLSVLDLEPEAAGDIEQGASSVVFADNVVDGDYGGRMFNATGVGPVSDVVVERNRVRNARWGISALAAPHAGSPRYLDIVFRGNVGEGSVSARGHAVLQFADVDNLVISDNVQRIDSAEAAIHLERVCNVQLGTNELAPVQVVTRDEGDCP